jgi:hypothetical protein
MNDNERPRPVLAARLKGLTDDGGDATITLTREEATHVLDVAEKAYALLVNAYSAPGDELGVRLKSEDAVRLQWALRQIGVGDDSGQPCFTV